MNTTENNEVAKYKTYFIIECIVGGILYLLMTAAFVLETIYPALRGGLAWGFVSTVIISSFWASIHYAKYLSLKK